MITLANWTESRRGLFADYSLKEQPIDKQRRDHISRLISEDITELYVDDCFKPTRGQVIKLESMGKKLFVKDESDQWICYTKEMLS